jgi:hypothetical protein
MNGEATRDMEFIQNVGKNLSNVKDTMEEWSRK